MAWAANGDVSVFGRLPDGGSPVFGGLPMAVPLYLVLIGVLYTYGETTVTFNSVLPSRPPDVRSLYQRVLSNRGAVLLQGPGFNDTVIPTCACGLVRYGCIVRTVRYIYANCRLFYTLSAA